MSPLSPGESWLLVLALFVAAWVGLQVLVVVDEGICQLVAYLRQWWQIRQLQQDDLARARKSRARALVKRVPRV